MNCDTSLRYLDGNTLGSTVCSGLLAPIPLQPVAAAAIATNTTHRPKREGSLSTHILRHPAAMLVKDEHSRHRAHLPVVLANFLENGSNSALCSTDAQTAS